MLMSRGGLNGRAEEVNERTHGGGEGSARVNANIYTSDLNALPTSRPLHLNGELNCKMTALLKAGLKREAGRGGKTEKEQTAADVDVSHSSLLHNAQISAAAASSGKALFIHCFS